MIRRTKGVIIVGVCVLHVCGEGGEETGRGRILSVPNCLVCIFRLL